MVPHSTMREESRSVNEASLLMTMSFASLQFSECKPTDGAQDVDRKTFEQWKEQFEAALMFAGVSSESMKFNAFRMKAGFKLLELLNSTISDEKSPNERRLPYSNAIHRLNNYYKSREYTLLQRQKLRSATQRRGEEDMDYVKRVAGIVKLCGYSDEQELEMVTDVIQSSAVNPKVREISRKFYRKGGAMANFMNKMEACINDTRSEEIYVRSHQKVAEVAAVSYGRRTDTEFRPSGYNRGPPSNQRGTFGYQGSVNRGPYAASSYQARNWNYSRGRGQARGGYGRPGTAHDDGRRPEPCWRCTSNFHSPEECYNATKICRRCGTQGHLERACRPSLSIQGALKAKRYHAEDDEDLAFTTADEMQLNELALNCSSSNEQEGPVLNCIDQPDRTDATVAGVVAGIPVTFIIDSGADVNTVGEETLDSLMNSDPLKSPIFSLKVGSDRPLKAYAGQGEVPVVACFVAELFISEERPRFMEKFYVVQNARALLSRGTSIRYSVLRLGLQVPLNELPDIDPERLLPGEIFVISAQDKFPKFNLPPVMLAYDKNLAPSRRVFTSIPPAFREETERRIEDLLRSGIIEQVTEQMDKSFCSSLLVVPKGKQDIRLVVDLRGPNQNIIRTPFKMPTLEEILSDLNGASWFSTIDLQSAFYHVELHEDCRHLTNFFSGSGTYRFVRLPFGLTNAPDIFQEALQSDVLGSCKGVINYLDDILVYGKSKLEHDRNLEAVLLRLQEHNVRLNSSKCVFGATSVKFLGFRLSQNGWSIEDDKRKAITNFRRPKTIAEVKSFLGLVNFTERFIPRRAEKTEKLRALTRGTNFLWTDEEENEFVFLKNEALNSITKLGYFDHNDKTELYVDVSPIGLGAVLIQFDTAQKPRIIACASKALTLAEKRYPQTQKEALAIVWSVERFTYYLMSMFFVIRTDSEANEYIFGDSYRTSRRAVSRAEAWALRLLPYHFRMERVPGHLNVADALSRLINRSQDTEPFDEDNDKHLLYALDAGFMNIFWTEIQSASETNEELENVRAGIRTGIWSKELKRYKAVAKSLRVLEPMVFKDDQIVLPSDLRKRALVTAHEGHIGCGATKRILRDFFWWPNMAKEADAFVSRCETCLAISRRNPPISISSRQLPDGPWEILQIDFLSLPGCGSGEFLLSVDTYSRYLHVSEMKHTDAKSTNAALCKMFSVWGLPLIIQSDNGPPYQSAESVEFWEAKGVRVRKSIPLSAQSNGAIERQNQGVIKAVAAAKQEGRSWKAALEEYIHIHNTRKHHSRLGITPFELLVGWRYRGTFPCLWSSKDMLDREAIREEDAVSKLVSKDFADSHRGAKQSDISTGDRVVVAVMQRTKTDPTFSREKFTVLTREGAKVVLGGESGVRITRNVKDVKRVPDDRDTLPEIAEPETVSDPASLPCNDQHVNQPGFHAASSSSRPKRDIRKPERFNDMVLYNLSA